MTPRRRGSILVVLSVIAAWALIFTGCKESGAAKPVEKKTVETAKAEETLPPCCQQKMDGAAENQKLVRSEETYEIPAVTLVDQDGEEVELEALLSEDKPVFLNFFFATCTTICPVLTAGFASFQDELGEESGNVRLVSVTIDPEHDSPDVLKEFSERFEAKEGWSFLTGSRENIDKVMKAFGAFVINKMNHLPLTFAHAPGQERWVRVQGFLNTMDHVKEYRTLLTP